ncbi:MAG: hypothetical protein F2813_07840 [Actinobacteria bacterium]|uniref:Unannotated protein n=1 Tax=freshwater metagenome TaxID=449393 RepID=A0A6J6A0I3_9ZZZZ|nr:hypothetical protein [Actinomycetota bacterium]
MTALESLPADQQAVLNLLVGQQKTYAAIAASLSLTEEAVSERAYEALCTLASPEKAPAMKRRSELCDYLLGQLPDSQISKTRDSLAKSPADRAWARAASAPLSAIPGGTIAEIPGATGPAPPKIEQASSAQASVGGGERSRGGLYVLAAAALAVALGAGFMIGRSSSPGDSAVGSSSTTRSATTAAKVTPIAQAALKPPAGAPASKAIGVAEISLQSGSRVLSVVAKAMPSPPAGTQYGVWLTATGKPPVWLGYFQEIGKTGGIALQGTLSGDPKLYSGVQISREKASSTPKSPGTTYLVGALRFSGS